jgi:hypothetical protein
MMLLVSNDTGRLLDSGYDPVNIASTGRFILSFGAGHFDRPLLSAFAATKAAPPSAILLLLHRLLDWLDREEHFQPLLIILRDKGLNLQFDLIPDLPYRRQLSFSVPLDAGGIDKGPVVPQCPARKERAALARLLRADRNHDVVTAALPEQIKRCLGGFAMQVVADLGHDLDHQRVQSSGNKTTTFGRKGLAAKMFEKGLGHLAARRVVFTDKKDMEHGLPRLFDMDVTDPDKGSFP